MKLNLKNYQHFKEIELTQNITILIFLHTCTPQ